MKLKPAYSATRCNLQIARVCLRMHLQHRIPGELHSDLSCLQSTRSYLYVEDVAEAFEVILRKGTVGETYNIGTQKERTVMDVAHSIAKHFNLPMDNIVHVRDRAFNDQR